MKHFTATERPTTETHTLWDAICAEAEKFMTIPQYTMFLTTPWSDLGGKSIYQAAVEEDTVTLQKALDLIKAETAHLDAAGLLVSA